MKRNVIILGGGISGLSAAYFLKQRNPDVDFLLLEKQPRLGGCLGSVDWQGHAVEKSARTFATARSPWLQQLSKELSLSLRFSPRQKPHRYVYDGTFHPIPPRGKQWLQYPWRKILFQWLKEPFLRDSIDEELTIAEWGRKRFGSETVDYLLDPLCKGILASPAELISISAAFPAFWESYRKQGNWFRYLLARKSGRRGKKPPALFNFEGGSQSLLDALERVVAPSIVRNCSVERVEGSRIHTSQGIFQAEKIICALPAFAAAAVFSEEPVSRPLAQIPYQDITLVNWGFETPAFSRRGFAYLMGGRKKTPIMGVVFNSQLWEGVSLPSDFITIFVQGLLSREELIGFLEEDVKRPLNIEIPPAFEEVIPLPQAIPCYRLGHQSLIRELEAHTQQLSVPVTWLGNYLDGVSIEHCVARAQNAVRVNAHLDSKQLSPKGGAFR